MATLRTVVNFKQIGVFLTSEFARRKFKKELGDTIVKAVKKQISIGKSPVAGEGRFAAYSQQRNKKKKKKRGASKSGYPASVSRTFPQKKVRPVNLFLSGDFLKFYDWANSGKLSILIGIVPGAPQLIRIIAKAHNEGVPEKNIPKRQHTPTKSGEEFTASIQRTIKNLFTKQLRASLKKRNK